MSHSSKDEFWKVFMLVHGPALIAGLLVKLFKLALLVGLIWLVVEVIR